MDRFNLIRDWAREKGIYEKGDVKTQFVKLQEETGELAKAILNKDEIEIVDSLGDVFIVLVSLSELNGFKLEDCIDYAYDTIKKRTGEMKNGTFVKD